VEENTIFLTPASFIAVNRFNVETTLLL